MKLHLFNAHAVARELAASDVEPELQAQYLLAGLIVYTVASYSGLVVNMAPLWSFPSLLEGAALVVVNLLGISQVFDAAGGRKSRRFLVDFTCLYVPVSVTSLLAVWGGFWAVRTALWETLYAQTASGSQFARNLAFIGTDVLGLLGFLCSVGSQALVYYRLVHLQRRVVVLRGGG